MLSSLGEVTGVVPGDDPPTIIVNSAMRRPVAPDQIAALAPDVRSRIVGLAPAATNGQPGEPPGAYATNAFDCLNLIALAASQAGSDDPDEIAALIDDVSEGGTPCRDFADVHRARRRRPQRRLRRPRRRRRARQRRRSA